MSKFYPSLERVSADVSTVLHRFNLYKDAIKIRHCYGFQWCKSPFCPRCNSRRAWREYQHLSETLSALLATDEDLQLWFLTLATEDSADVHSSARAAVAATRRLLRHPRIASRVVAYFAVAEVATKHLNAPPCVHTHAILVTRPMDQGRHRISQGGWVNLWEECCSLARKRNPNFSLKRQNPRHPARDLSAVMLRVPRCIDDLERVTRYVCKGSLTSDAVAEYRQQLLDPSMFIDRVADLQGTTRFFGPLHRQRPKPRAVTTEAVIELAVAA
jgi:hypothetical protein